MGGEKILWPRNEKKWIKRLIGYGRIGKRGRTNNNGFKKQREKKKKEKDKE